MTGEASEVRKAKPFKQAMHVGNVLAVAAAVSGEGYFVTFAQEAKQEEAAGAIDDPAKRPEDGNDRLAPPVGDPEKLANPPPAAADDEKKEDANVANDVTKGLRVEDIVDPPAEYRYAAFGRADPFVPGQAEAAKQDEDIPIASLLQKYGINQLKLVGIWRLESGARKALMMTPKNEGIIAKVGDPIGLRRGRILRIEEDNVVVREFNIAPDGTRQFDDLVIAMNEEEPIQGLPPVGARPQGGGLPGANPAPGGIGGLAAPPGGAQAPGAALQGFPVAPGLGGREQQIQGVAPGLQGQPGQNGQQGVAPGVVPGAQAGAVLHQPMIPAADVAPPGGGNGNAPVNPGAQPANPGQGQQGGGVPAPQAPAAPGVPGQVIQKPL